MNPAEVIDQQGSALVPHQSTVATPMEMLASAIDKGMAPETVDKLLALADRWDRMNARKAFDQAIAKAKANIPVIVKNATGHNAKKYANFAAIASAVDPVLGEHGLSYRFRTVQDDKSIRVTCVLSHEAGHSEETTLLGPADTTGSKNAIQAIGSTLTYLQRYTLVQMLGLASTEDDDGKTADTRADASTITDEQVDEISKLLTETKSNLVLFLNKMKIEGLTELRIDQFDGVMALIRETAKKRADREAAASAAAEKEPAK